MFFLAADRARSTPWEMAGLKWSKWWTEWALIALAAENAARKPLNGSKDTGAGKQVDSLSGLGIPGIP